MSRRRLDAGGRLDTSAARADADANADAVTERKRRQLCNA
jgi:hypothetical protein